MNFPRLRTGARAQYPTRRRIEYQTEVFRFVDGSEQRYRSASGGLRSWCLSFRQIDEQEAAGLRDLFAASQGGFGSFVFVDPWDGMQYEDCSLRRDELRLEWEDEGKIRTEIEVRENRR